jgi:serine carboxypeptidase-like clade 1
MAEYINLPSVMAAIHVVPNNQTFHYRQTAGNLLPLYASLITKYRMLIYSGDVDACIPFVGTEEVSGFTSPQIWRIDVNFPLLH